MKRLAQVVGVLVTSIAFAAFVAAAALLALGLYLLTRRFMSEPERQQKRKAITNAAMAALLIGAAFRPRENSEAE